MTTTRSALSDLAAAVSSSAAVSWLATRLGRFEIPVMVLKGPPVQRRFFGKENVYRSADVDLLVHPEHAKVARRVLRASGWQFAPHNGVLWRRDRAAAFTRSGITIDLHWGLHAYMVSPRLLRRLEEPLWRGAQRSNDGWLEPEVEPLLVYLSVNAAGKRFGSPAALALIRTVAQKSDWSRVEAIARESRLWGTVQQAVALTNDFPRTGQPPLFDGRVLTYRLAIGSLLRRSLALAPLRASARMLRRRLIRR